MERRFHAYLWGERCTGLFLAGWAVLSASAAGLAYHYWPGKLLQAMLMVVCLLSLVQLRAGVRRLWQARRLKKALHPIVEIAPPSFAAQEIPRLEDREQVAMRRRFLEQALFVMGLCFALAGGFRVSGDFLLGTGIGLCIQMAVLLIVTLTSQWRDSVYRNEVERERGPF
ncbi:MAG: hypothetical protein H6556_08280 [Lewinellaceae bacterium]|nr:hypothetical protein [Lewinellaceae bacterium]